MAKFSQPSPAPHVQAAIAQGQGGAAQPKKPVVRGGMAAHVQAAVARGQGRAAQPKAPAVGSGRELAAHVQAAIAISGGAAAQAKQGPGGALRTLQASAEELPGKRSRRSSTAEQTEASRRLAVGYEPPTKRERRKSGTYSNVEAFSDSKGPDPGAAIRQAEKEKKVWAGVRPHWRGGFAEGFWAAKKGPGGWECAHKYESCRQPAAKDSHAELEIGHKEGIYGYVSKKCDMKVLCDGENHWHCFLYADVVQANEDLSNLEPQCKTCNRDPRQKKKDESAGEQKPMLLGPCPGKSCAEKKLSAM